MSHLRSCFFLLACLCVCSGAALAEQVDSLWHIVHTAPDEEDQLIAYYQLIGIYESSDTAEALRISREAIQQLELGGFPTDPSPCSLFSQARLCSYTAFVYFLSGDYLPATQWFQRSAKIFSLNGQGAKAIGQLNNTSVCFRRMAMYDSAAITQLEVLTLAEKLQDTTGWVRAHIQQGNIFESLKDYSQAGIHYREANRLAQAGKIYEWGGAALVSIGLLHAGQKAYDSAVVYYQQSLPFHQTPGWEEMRAKTQFNLGMAYVKLNQFEDAKSPIEAAQAHFLQHPAQYKIELSMTRVGLAQIAFQKSPNPHSLAEMEAGLASFEQMEMQNERIKTLKSLSEGHEMLQNPQAALAFFKEWVSLRDSVQSIDLKERIADLETQYETEKERRKAAEWEALHQQEVQKNQLQLLIGLGIMLIFLAAGILQYFRGRHRAAMLQEKMTQYARELDVLRAKIELGTTQYNVPGEFQLSAEVINDLLKDQLSDRELEVFVQLCSGKTNREIAEALFVSINTIKFHLQNIYVKLDVSNRKDAIQMVNQRAAQPQL
ncbi:LuxR C-terminal-related transcriptional regulator [Pontibacter sp. G13]|uniref:LuxR C-terminal-related transcriptional regulator n=1 Tax=Pontibacter sp. G13 TaxID=3074898 RepID=UPI00288AE8DB|nr:LuxR C-terminal-related transcriptional regulator [Pontibacter sp. G13]WNJ16983.1 LuxR C-terminal-related transcriptional regulator [Pontibacter sp. G13]